MKTIFKLQLWVPFAFSLVLSAIALGSTMLSKQPLPAGAIPFLCFLPMTFYFVAQVTLNYVTKLEKRLEALETRLGTLNP